MAKKKDTEGKDVKKKPAVGYKYCGDDGTRLCFVRRIDNKCVSVDKVVLDALSSKNRNQAAKCTFHGTAPYKPEIAKRFLL